MLNANEIKNIKFGKAMGGYRQDEVDVLLDKVEADYLQYERIVKEFQDKVEALNTEISQYKESQSSIQNVLLSAQSLADKIISEAKEKSDEIIKSAEKSISDITSKEKELSAAFELKAKERKTQVEKELTELVKAAQLKADSITAAAEDSVARQQTLYNKLKIEIATFKSAITGKYKEQLEILSTIPDTVPQDPVEIAKIVSATVDKMPDPLDYIKIPSAAPISGGDVNTPSGFKVAEEEKVTDNAEE